VGNVKAIINKLVMDHPTQWDQYLPSILWSLREAVNSTTDLAPWALVFGHVSRGLLMIVKNHWTGVEKLPVIFGKSAMNDLREVQKNWKLLLDMLLSIPR